ncbi:hypothetical protein Peur_019189 [Populus x canadensis]
MARQADRLVKIGQEGFAAIDEHFGRAKRRPPVMKVPYAHLTYYYVPATEVIDSNEAAQRYEGRVYIDYPKGKPADRLVKIGQEGFAAIDELFDRAKWRQPVMKVPYAHPTYYYVPATEVIDSNEAAQRYKGRVYVDYPKGKPVPF